MKILIVHTYYQSPGGEDVVFKQETALLAKTVSIKTLTFQNQKSWKGFIQTALSPWNIVAGSRLKKAIHDYQPDVIHFHNLHYAIGPIAIRIAKKAGIPVVMTLHNYRLLCPSANLLYKGKIFVDSIQASFPWKAVFKGMHSHSIIKTFWLAWVNWFHRKIGTWAMVNRYIVLTNFAKDLFVRSSFDISQSRFVVKPNFSSAQKQVQNVREDYFLYLGRLSEEKGIRLLLDAFEHTNLPIQIAGDGPFKEKVLDACRKHSNIHYLGSLDYPAAQKALRCASALVFPSVCFEGMPLTIIEAFANGTPVIASNIGAMYSMIEANENGLLFEAGDAKALNHALAYWVTLSEKEQRHFQDCAWESYQKQYAPEENRKKLIEVYEGVVRSAMG